MHLLLALFALTAVAEPVRTDHVAAELVSENRSLVAGGEDRANLVAVRLEMAPEWHTYWRFPGDSGLPTEIAWHLPPGWSAGATMWPVPHRIFVPPLVNYGYDGVALLAAPLHVPKGAEGDFPIGASVTWLVCKEECVPGKAELSFTVHAGSAPPAPGPLARAFAALRDDQPGPGAVRAKVVSRDKDFGLVLEQKDVHDKIDFFPLTPSVLKGDVPPRLERAQGKTTLWLEKGDPVDPKATELRGILVYTGKDEPRVRELVAPLAPAAAESVPAPAETSSWLLIVFAFLGGLILNLMPCVFPVLGIKVMSLVRQSGSEQSHARKHGLAYAAGVVACFWTLAAALLALRAAGQSVGWGFQLQQPMFVTTLVLLFTFVGADLAGFIHWSGRWMGAGSGLAEREGLSGSFFTGVLAVVVATPCTAPFMGTAIGAAIAEPGWVVFCVFTALGLGLAAPFVILCYHPAYLRVLPKPGAWMERLKELFAFPIAATVIWLLWVLTLQVGADGALKVEGGLLVLMLSVWARRRFAGGGARFVSHALLAVGVLLCGRGAQTAQAGPGMVAEGAWKSYSESALRDALASGKPAFVDFTAAWCLTCQVNKKLVLDRSSMQDYFREKGVALFLADWTNRDPAIAKALEAQGRIGVPLYLAYPAGATRPEVLPQILTEERLRASFR